MFIVMNRFSVDASRADEFEEIWRTRESMLNQMTGFLEFQLLRSSEKEGRVLFISKVNWTEEKNFSDWVQSDQFKQAHAKKRMPEGIVMGPPQFETFEVVLNQEKA
jgi:heme-degrading monooxygenase HmoA